MVPLTISPLALKTHVAHLLWLKCWSNMEIFKNFNTLVVLKQILLLSNVLQTIDVGS